METVGINMTHDASFCHCVDGKVDFFIEEERLSRNKHDHTPVRSIIEYFESNHAGVTGLQYEDLDLPTLTSYIELTLNKKSNTVVDLYEEHHVLHAMCGFYNSEFEEADVVVVDGMGNYSEVASRFRMSRPSNIKLLEKQVDMGIGMVYSSISEYLGFGQLGSGKVMGLAPYGKEDPEIKPFVIEDEVNSSLFNRTQGGSHCGYALNFIPYDYLPKHWDYRNWNEDVQRIANLAYRLQKDFEKWMTNFILKCDHKNIVLTGGCALNCVANYEYLKHLPKDVNLYIEPVSNDAGTAIGLAKYLYYHERN
tara:strand:+ start:134 stop:1057 length:924 start_codon:yes stop_codon:yes gene_type:complete